MEIGSFEVVSKIFVVKLFSRNVAFSRNVGESAKRVTYTILTTLILYGQIKIQFKVLDKPIF